MTNNLEQISSILSHFKDLLSENPELKLNENIVYNYLINFNVPNEEYEIDIKKEGLFDKWEKNSEELENVIYNKSNNWIDSCLFTDKNNKVDTFTNPIKIYIPIKYNYIEESVNKLLAFFSKKNMPYQLKISRYINNNNVIVRLVNIDDLNKLINFIKYNEYINEGLISPNPFCYNEESLALTIDNNLSYISIIANYIYKYLLTKKDNIEEIKTHDFYNYIIDMYKNTFVNYSNYSNLQIPGLDEFDELDIISYQNITELLLKVSENSFKREDFEEHLNECNNVETIKKNKKKYSTLNTFISFINMQKENKSDVELLNILKRYIETGNLSCITNDCSLRTTMYLSKFRINMQKLLESNNISLETLYNNLNPKGNVYEKLDDKKLNSLIMINNDILREALDELTKLYDYNNATKIIQLYLATNDYNIITRENDLRNRVVNANLRSNTLTILFNKHISFNKYLESLRMDIDESYILRNAINETYNKYQSLYEEGKVECDGFTLVNYALTNLLKNNDYNSFTRNNEARKNLSQLNQDNVFDIITKELELPITQLENIPEENLQDIIRKYLDYIFGTEQRN